jgi:chemotaxis protein MotB
MATFADMATLLMAFFVLILSFAEMNVPKFKQINGSLKNSFGVQRLIPVVESPKAQSLVARHFTPSVAEPTPINTIRQQTTDDRKENVEVKTDVAPEAQKAVEALQQALAQEVARGEAEVRVENGKVVVELMATPGTQGGSGRAGPQTSGSGSAGARDGGSAAAGSARAGAADSGSRTAGAAAQGSQAAGAGAAGSQTGGASKDGAQSAGPAPSGTQTAGAAAQGARQAGTVPQGEIEFFARVADVQSRTTAAVEVRDTRNASAAGTGAAARDTGAGSGPGAAGSNAAQQQAQAQSQLERLRQALAKEISAGKVEVERDGARIIVRLAEQGSFRSGSADLQPGFMQTLTAVGRTIAQGTGSVFIEGHTDNVPVAFNERFRSNWDLSAGRSAAVADYLSGNAGVQPSRLRVSGHADTRPIDTNDSAAGRARNRRIEVIIDGAGG